MDDMNNLGQNRLWVVQSYPSPPFARSSSFHDLFQGKKTSLMFKNFAQMTEDFLCSQQTELRPEVEFEFPTLLLVLVCLRVSFELAGGDFNGPFLGFWRCSAVFLRGVNKVASSASRALLGIFRKGSICARELQEHLRDSGGSWSSQLKLPQLGIPREWREKFPSPLISSAHPVCASPVAQGCPQELKFYPNWEKAANKVWFL